MFNDFCNLIEKRVFPVQSTEELFNQYKDVDSRVDLPNAHEIRRKNLKSYLESLERPKILVVGEAAGPWGCRFSGVSFTGEKHLLEENFPFSGHQSSKPSPSLITHKRPPYTSTSANIFWKVMKPYHQKFLVWDCVPFHPHEPGKILSIRNPTTAEALSFSGLLNEIKEIIKPERIVAVGREAEDALNKIGVQSRYVRHPSHGGAKDFEREMKRIFSESG